MMCPSCHGQHWVIRAGQMTPCPECGGIGEIHCCDGLTAQADYSLACAVVSPPSSEAYHVPFAREE